MANLLATEAGRRVSLARRLALLDALQNADRPLLADELMARVEARLGERVWDGTAIRTLRDDIRRLKAAGFMIQYRRGRIRGYVWGGPHGPVDNEAIRQRIEEGDPDYLKAVARLTPQEKLERAAEMGRWAKSLKARVDGESS